MELDAAGSVSGATHSLAAATTSFFFCVCVQGFNAGNYARHAPVCSSLLLKSTLKVKPYIFIYEPFKSDCRTQCSSSPNSFWIYCTGCFTAPHNQPYLQGFYRKTLYLCCFIQKIAQTRSAYIVVAVELSQRGSDVSYCNGRRQTVNVVYVTGLWVALWVEAEMMK